MTTATWDTPIAHATDADFRSWGSELSTKIAAAGLVKTADTGQVDWSTALRPTGTSSGVYEVWGFNDGLQATAPIFLRLEYVTYSSGPALRLQVGVGTDGAGNILAPIYTQEQLMGRGAPDTGSFISNICCTDGFFGLVFKRNSYAGLFSPFAFAVVRSTDATGTPTGEAAVVYTSDTSSGVFGVAQVLRFADPARVFEQAQHTHVALVPHDIDDSHVGLDVQVLLNWMPTPKIAPVFGLCTVFAGEVPPGTTFSTALVGTIERTYIAFASQDFGRGSSSTVTALAMLWE